MGDGSAAGCEASVPKNTGHAKSSKDHYGHDVSRFDEFARRYRAELSRPPAAAAADHLVTVAEHQHLTLVTATRDVEHSGAVVLEQHLDHLARTDRR